MGLVIHLAECEPEQHPGWEKTTLVAVSDRETALCPQTSYMDGELLPDEEVWVEQVADPPATAQAWTDLIAALTLLARGQNNDTDPVYHHDYKMIVCADPAAFSAEEIEQLERWGFSADLPDKVFYSFKYGSS